MDKLAAALIARATKSLVDIPKGLPRELSYRDTARIVTLVCAGYLNLESNPLGGRDIARQYVELLGAVRTVLDNPTGDV